LRRVPGIAPAAARRCQRVLSEAYAKGKTVSDAEVARASMVAKQSDAAAKEVKSLTGILADSSLRNAAEKADLRRKLEAAEKKAAEWRARLEQAMKIIEGRD
jgi:hypothetical protein